MALRFQLLRFTKACCRLAKARIDAWKESRTDAGRAATREKELLGERERQREQRKLERDIARLKAAETDTPGQKELAIREIPVPQIIDASQRRAIDPELIGKNPFSRKPSPEHQGLQEGRFPNYKIPEFDILDPLPDVEDSDRVGIEIANSNKVTVPLHELLHDPEFRCGKNQIPLALGKDVCGKTLIGDLAAMPHLLIGGPTGSGKSVCIHSIIASILFKFGPDELRFIMVDTNLVEMQMYNRLPHVVIPVVTDPKKTVAALKWVLNEMEKRYKIFAKKGVRNFDGFNNRYRKPKEKVVVPEAVEPEVIPGEPLGGGPEPEAPFDPSELLDPAVPNSHQAPAWSMMEDDPDENMDSLVAALSDGDLGPEEDEEDEEVYEEQIPTKFPYIVVLIDELTDLMQTAPTDVEMCIARIAHKGRTVGIHLVIATARADVVTRIIKANIPSRIAFQVSSTLDSCVILGSQGADKLVGKGDMLYLTPGSAKLERAQGAFVTDAEIERLIDHCAAQAKPQFEKEIQASINGEDGDDDDDVSDADEELITRCIEVVRQEQKASTSLLQRRLGLGYTRAARMIDILEQRGVVGPGEGVRAREVFLR